MYLACIKIHCQYITDTSINFSLLFLLLFHSFWPPRKLAAPVKRDTFDKVAQPLPFPSLFPPNIVWIMSLWIWQSTHARHCHPRHLPVESLLSNPVFFASSKSFHLEGKRDSPSGFVHCCETSTATRAAHKKNQKC